MPDPVLRYEKHANPAHARILKTEDHMMMPKLSAGDRVVFDTSRLWPPLGEFYVMWDGNAIVV